MRIESESRIGDHALVALSVLKKSSNNWIFKFSAIFQNITFIF